MKLQIKIRTLLTKYKFMQYFKNNILQNTYSICWRDFFSMAEWTILFCKANINHGHFQLVLRRTIAGHSLNAFCSRKRSISKAITFFFCRLSLKSHKWHCRFLISTISPPIFVFNVHKTFFHRIFCSCFDVYKITTTKSLLLAQSSHTLWTVECTHCLWWSIYFSKMQLNIVDIMLHDTLITLTTHSHRRVRHAIENVKQIVYLLRDNKIHLVLM